MKSHKTAKWSFVLCRKLYELSTSRLPRASSHTKQLSTSPLQDPQSPIPHRVSPAISLTPLPIRFLIPRSRAWATKLLRLTSPIIRHQKRPVILNEGLLELILRILVDVFLIVGDD